MPSKPTTPADAIYRLSEHVHDLVHGNADEGALGFEALIMAIQGPVKPGENAIVPAIDRHTAAVADIATAIHDLADAVRGRA